MRLVVFVAILLASHAAFTAETFSVATLNCEFLSSRKVHMKFGLPFDEEDWTDQQRAEWRQPEFRRARYREAVDAIARAVRRIDADVVVLTEVARVPTRGGEFVTPNDLTILHEALRQDYPYLAYGESLDTVTFQNVAVLSRRPFQGEPRQRIAGREYYDAELDDLSEREARVTKGLAATVRVDGEPVTIYAVHLKSERGGHESDAQRVAQASIIRRNYLRDIRRGHHVLVVGDLNDHRGQPTLRRIRGRDDIEEDLVQTGGPSFLDQRGGETYADFSARMRDAWTYEYRGERNQLDHILISQSIRRRATAANGRKRVAIEFIDIDEKIGGSGHPATDHRAVKLRLEFTAGESHE
jgi:endonuclease/exonuclease/phosphatase family metal-dependent hydrolase